MKKIKGFYYVCLTCGKTKNKLNKDGECMECANENVGFNLNKGLKKLQGFAEKY